MECHVLRKVGSIVTASGPMLAQCGSLVPAPDPEVLPHACGGRRGGKPVSLEVEEIMLGVAAVDMYRVRLPAPRNMGVSAETAPCMDGCGGSRTQRNIRRNEEREL